jgi:uncharacterized repeat protein (TIGR03803 family)
MKENRIVLSVCLLTIAAAGVSAGQMPQGGPIADGQGGGPGPHSAYKVLYSFTGGADGGNPSAGGGDGPLVRDWQGNLYGTATEGGLINDNNPYGSGVVFKVDPSGKETVLHAFGGPPDGGYPLAGLIMDAEGSLYGTTLFGGTGNSPAGTVFKIDHNGKYKVLYSFSGPDGSGPSSSLTLDIWGNLYGTTNGGGEFCVPYGGCGVVFKLDPNGKETVLHSFSGMDGNDPGSNLILDEWGNMDDYFRRKFRQGRRVQD